VRLPAKLDWLEERAIEAALRATGGNRARAAALLGINRVTLYKKLR
jgi:DNA-binding protein Fis